MADPTQRPTGNGRRSIRNAMFASNLVRRLDLEHWARVGAQRERDPEWQRKKREAREKFDAQTKAIDDRRVEVSRPDGWVFTDPRTGATITVPNDLTEHPTVVETFIRWLNARLGRAS